MAETLFGTSIPTFTLDSATTPVTLGLRLMFGDTVTITKIRFYKVTAADSGLHEAGIWNNDGSTLLATATFSGETATGWQEVSLSTPLRLPMGYYIVGIYHPNGNFGYVDNKFTTNATVASSKGWLSPEASSVRGNGTYIYAAGFQLPSNGSVSQTWYLMDVELEHPGDWPSSMLLDQEFTTSGSDGPYTLGTRFTTDVDGEVVGVRWYHATNEHSSPRTVLLYDGSGVELARKTATVVLTENAVWKRIDFDTPVSITPGQTYTVAYVTSLWYNGFPTFFASVLDRPPLHTPVNAGRFNAGITPAYPTSSFNNGCYFVDPVVAYNFTGWDMQA